MSSVSSDVMPISQACTRQTPLNLPMHNRYFQQVLHHEEDQVHVEASQHEHQEIETVDQDNNSESIWQPVRYRIKYGLGGCYVLQSTAPGDPSLTANHEDLQQITAAAEAIAEEAMPLQPEEEEEEEEEEDDNTIHQEMLHALRNPQVQASEQCLAEGIAILYDRLHHAGWNSYQIGTPAAILQHTFTRRHLSKIYGGNSTETFSTIDERKAGKGGYRRFMCINLLFNPHGPQWPGAPGLFYALRDIGRWPSRTELVFSRYSTNNWNLMGKYRIVRSQSLTSTEFASLGDTVQQTWTNSIFSHCWGSLTLAAIYLRRKRAGREPEEAEIQYYATRKSSLLLRSVTKDEVIAAFLNGEEKINVWTMTCIGYDEDFKRRLVPPTLLRTTRNLTAGEGSINTSYDLRSKKQRKPSAKAKASMTKATQKGNAKRRRI